MDLKGIKLTWLGHATFRIQTPKGKTLYIDPWLTQNPLTPAAEKEVRKCDIMLCSHAHFDHIGDAVSVIQKHQPKVVAIFELGTWLGKKGAKNVSPMNKGGTQKVDDVEVTMVHAVHSCGIQEDDGSIIYGGEACGYVIHFDNGLRLYHAGDTAVFGDMAIIRDLYAPDIACLPIGDHFVMSPKEAAYACSLLRPKAVIPMHFGTFPLLRGTPAELKQLVADMGVEVIDMKPGETI